MKFFKHKDILDPQHLDTPEKILRYFPVGSRIRKIYNTGDSKEYTVVSCRRYCIGRLCSDCRSDGHVLDIMDGSNRTNVACIYTQDGYLTHREVE